MLYICMIKGNKKFKVLCVSIITIIFVFSVDTYSEQNAVNNKEKNIVCKGGFTLCKQYVIYCFVL